jgi:elongation factor P
MPTISTNDMRAGQYLMHNGRIVLIADYERMKPGKGPTFVRAKLKDIETGQVLDQTWRGEQKVEQVILRARPHQYLYRQGDLYTFMDLETYEQVALDKAMVAGWEKYMLENMEVKVVFNENTPVKVERPDFLELKVADTAPGVRGDTVSGATKPATLETGAVIQVPLFVNAGDIVKVDTRSDAYVTRV